MQRIPCIGRLSRDCLKEAEIHYNVEFDLDHSQDAKRHQDVIIDYVMKRQLEIWVRGRAA